MEYIQILKNEEIYTGALFYIEGELMNVIVKNPSDFHAGDSIICLLDSHRFFTTIIKKQDFNLFIYVTWAQLQNLNERRRAVRIPYQSRAKLKDQAEIVTVEMMDISIGGLGFESKQKLKVNETYQIFLIVEDREHCLEVIIKNERPVKASFRYGCHFIHETETDLFPIRRYILYKQLQKLSDHNEKIKL